MAANTKCNTKFINKLPLDQSVDKFIIVESKWLANEIAINILEFNETSVTAPIEWCGTLPIEQIKETCDALDKPYDNIYDECKNALCQANGLPNFIYTIDGGNFIWKKDTGRTKLIYGRVALSKSCENLHLKFLLNSLDMCSELRINLRSKEVEIAELDSKHKQFLEKYDDYVAIKQQHDDELLKKFLLLLNSKKAKIAELKDLLYENGNANEESQLFSASDAEENLAKADEKIVEGTTTVLVHQAMAHKNDQNSPESSQSQDLLGITIPKRKQATFDGIASKVSKANVVEDNIGNNQEDPIDNNVFEVDTQLWEDV